ncbi:TPA: hypothetical protein L6B08_16865 [Pseudomonas aeruginosa]|nr:hypothetical protein [Pseudomonas aeruginosa]
MNIELLKPHTHAGVGFAPGDSLDLDESAARWLIEVGVAKAADGLHESAGKPQPTARKGD